MNAKLGKEKVFSQVVGRHTLHDISNENGEMVANYAISNDMFLTSTNFQHKKIHIRTWTSTDHQTTNQVVHFFQMVHPRCVYITSLMKGRRQSHTQQTSLLN